MDTLFIILKYMFNFLAVISVFIILILITSDSYLKKNKLNQNNLKFYGVFFELSNKQLMSFSLSIIKLLFLLYSLIIANVNSISFLFIIIITILFNILNVRFINLFLDAIFYSIIYLILLSKDIFLNYLINVSVEWYVVVFYALSLIFAFIIIMLLFFREFDYIIKKNDYVRKKVNNDLLKYGIFRKKELKKVLEKVADQGEG